MSTIYKYWSYWRYIEQCLDYSQSSLPVKGKDGILIFRDDPLEYVFKRLGQTYNVEFILKDAKLGKYSYKATFEGESLNEILRLLEMSAPIRCKEVSNRNTNNEKFEKQRIEVSRTMQ